MEMFNLYLTILLGVLVSEMGFVYGFEKDCLKYRGFSPSVMEELDQKMTCVKPEGKYI